MKTLILDSSFLYLVIAIADDNGKLVFNHQLDLPKQQSEFIFVEIVSALEETGYSINDLDRIVITRGPGSYTGTRIAMTIAKVLVTLLPSISLYTVSTLQAIAGLQSGFAFIDARSKRVYGASIDNGRIISEKIYQFDDLSDIDDELFGQLSLLGKADKFGNLAQNILDLQSFWVKVDQIDSLVPAYLKENAEYGSSTN